MLACSFEISSELLALRLCALCYLFAFIATLLEAPLLLSADVAKATVVMCSIGTLASCYGVIKPNVVSGFAQLVFYRRLQRDGGQWFGFAWETQLDETGLLCFVLSLAPPGPALLARASRFFARVALHVLAFRVMLAAGLLKMRAHEQCWQDHTCLYYHFTTTPQPTPLAYYAAQLPGDVKEWMQWASIDLAEIVLPFGFLFELPRVLLSSLNLTGTGFFTWILLVGRWVAAAGTLGLMAGIQLTGNYSFLQLLTAIPCAAALGVHGGRDSLSGLRAFRVMMVPRAMLALLLTLVLGLAAHPGIHWLSTGGRRPNPVRWVPELIGGGSSFSSGRFASMTKVRDEASVHVLRCEMEGNCSWSEVDIHCKVGSVSHRPCFTSPLHRRFAWQWWFLGLGSDTTWLRSWLLRLKDGEPEAWLAFESADDDVWEIRAVTLFMHRYEWNLQKPLREDLRIVEGYPLVDEADGSWWSRGKGKHLVTVNMSTKWQRQASLQLRWWVALQAWMARTDGSLQDAAWEVFADFHAETRAWLKKLSAHTLRAEL